MDFKGGMGIDALERLHPPLPLRPGSVERQESEYLRQCLRRASGRSTHDLRALIHRFIQTWNTHFAHPFDWTYTGKPLAVSSQQYELLLSRHFLRD
jgi:hypothetical protein